MIKEEFKFIAKNRLVIITLLAVVIIPFLYCIFFLRSVWDPYGNTKNLPVAVVNEDRAVKFNNSKVNIGKQTVDKLKKNDSLGWHFVSAKEAKSGLKKNKYYTVVTIPQNFSKNAATVLSTHPKKMELKYETNGSLNYIGQVISKSGMTQLDKEIRARVTNAYASALFSQFKLIGKGMSKASKGANQLDSGLVTLDDGINTYTLNVSKVNNGVQTLKLNVNPLSSGVNRLSSGASSLTQGINQYISGASRVTSGINTLNSNVGTLTNGIQSYTGGVGQLASGIGQLNGKTGSLSNGTSQLVAGSQSLVNGTNDYVSGVGNLNQGIGQLNQSASNLPNGVSQVSQNVDKISQAVSDIKAGIQKTQTQSADQVKKISAEYTATKEAIGSNSEATAKLDEMFADVQKFASAQNDQAEKTLLPALTKVQDSSQSLSSSVNNDLGGKAKQLVSALQTLNSGSQTLANKGSSLTSGASQINNGLKQLNQNVPALISGVSQLNGGAQSLSSRSSQLNGGAQQLASGINALNTGGSSLNSYGSSLSSGASQISSGLSTLSSQLPTLDSGISQLASGTSQLTAKNNTLTNGANKLKAGSKTLAISLNSGSKQVNGINLTKETADMFAQPTNDKQVKYTNVTNYGHALAPYVLSLALYMGAIVFNTVYPIRRAGKKDITAKSWYLSKLAVGGLVGTAMAFVETSLMIIGGLGVEHLGLFYLVAWLFALFSVYFIMFLSMSLNNPGRFLAMIGLMIQLGGSGGTFPMQLTDHFYNVIHPYLPMSYSIMGFRQAIAGGIYQNTVINSLLILFVLVIISAILLWFAMKNLQKKQLMEVKPADFSKELPTVED